MLFWDVPHDVEGLALAGRGQEVVDELVRAIGDALLLVHRELVDRGRLLFRPLEQLGCSWDQGPKARLDAELPVLEVGALEVVGPLQELVDGIALLTRPVPTALLLILQRLDLLRQRRVLLPQHLDRLCKLLHLRFRRHGAASLPYNNPITEGGLYSEALGTDEGTDSL